MAIINQPALLTSAIADNGDKNTIPQTTDPTQGYASISEGFPQITSQPISAGGVPPRREDFNGLFNLISQFLLYYQNGGVGNYNATLDYAPTQIASHNGTIWMCLKLNGANTSVGTKEPNSNNSEYWQELGGGLMQGATANANGKKGVVPAPSAGQQNMYLQGNGKWTNPPFYPLTGGVLNGNIFLSGTDYVASINNNGIFRPNNYGNIDNNAQNLGDNFAANLNIVSWYGVTFGTTQGHENEDPPRFIYKSTIGIDCRNGILKTMGDIISNNGVNLSRGVIVASSLSANGYVKFANGLIMQWGYYGTIPSESNKTVTLPIAFKQNAFYVMASTPTHNPANRGVYGAEPVSSTEIRLTNGNSTIYNVRWFAIGY